METVFGIPVESMTLLKGGANNRVHLLNNQYVVKEYFQHPDDPRRRLETEYRFLSFAWEQGLRQIPQPLQCDAVKALYTKVPGALAQNPSDGIIRQALAFYLQLNESHERGKHLANASEAAISPSIALEAIESRLQRLKTVLPELTDRLEVLFENCQQYKNLPLCLDDLRLSPSDFGLHNILIDQENAYFLDFEYAGWDDPAKTVCDFFTSPRIPVPKTLFQDFAHAVAQKLNDPDSFYKRLSLHFPLSQIKWCCVILNIFLKTDQTRRVFSQSSATLDEQLEKAHRYLEQFSMEIPCGLR